MIDPLLEVDDLIVRFGGLAAVAGVSLTVAPGEVVGLIGPNGAGKTTCIDALTGYVAATAGRVRFGGEDVTSLAIHRRAALGLVRTFQSLELFDDLSVRENLVVAADRPSWWAPLADAVRPNRTRQRDVDWALEIAGLAGVEDRLPSELANGPRHLLALARAIASRPRLVLLDEPAAGLDANERATLAAHLRGLPARGIAVLLVDHDMDLVMGVCDRVYVLDFGRVIADGTPAVVRSNPEVVRAYLGAPSHSESTGR